MNNYSIDASVYAYPFHASNPKLKEITNYILTINKFNKLLENKQFHVKYFLFKSDIELIGKHKDLDFTEKDVSSWEKFLLERKNISINIEAIRDEFTRILSKLVAILLTKKGNNDLNDENDFANFIIFENWFDIEDVRFIDNKKPSLPDEIDKSINNKLKENTIKNIAKISALNKFVYNGAEMHSIILGHNKKIETIPVTTNLEIKMMKDYDTSNKVDSIYKIRNMPTNNVTIQNQNVKISPIESFVTDNEKYKTWKEAFNAAKTGFSQRLTFGKDGNDKSIIASITQYINTIHRYRGKFEGVIGDEIDNWLKVFPNVLYANLKVFYDFQDVMILHQDTAMGMRQIPKGFKEWYHCNMNKCEIFDICYSYIHFLGVNCSGERDEHKKNSDVIRDRNINGNLYNMHLKINTKPCYDDLWFLTLRIHFREFLDTISGKKKIEIGWIGRHLYLPCNPKKRGKGIRCKEEECPLFDTDNLPNYLKQFPLKYP
jgi:hypothetical protein